MRSVYRSQRDAGCNAIVEELCEERSASVVTAKTVQTEDCEEEGSSVAPPASEPCTEM